MGGSLVRHGGQNPIEPIKLGAAILHGPHVSNFDEIYGELDRAGAAELVTDTGEVTLRIGAWIKDGAERDRIATAARHCVDRFSGALDRTVSALEPYFMQLRIQNRTAQCVTLPSGGASAAPPRRCWNRSRRCMAPSRRDAWQGPVAARQCPWCASATSPLAAPARRRPPLRWRDILRQRASALLHLSRLWRTARRSVAGRPALCPRGRRRTAPSCARRPDHCGARSSGGRRCRHGGRCRCSYHG